MTARPLLRKEKKDEMVFPEENDERMRCEGSTPPQLPNPATALIVVSVP